MPSFTTSGTSRPRPRPRPSRRLWNYRRLGTYKVPRGRSSPGRRYLGTVRPRLNPAKQCAIMARKARYRYFGVRSRRYCYGASLRSPLTRFGKTFGVGGMVVYKEEVSYENSGSPVSTAELTNVCACHELPKQ